MGDLIDLAAARASREPAPAGSAVCECGLTSLGPVTGPGVVQLQCPNCRDLLTAGSLS